MDQIFFGPKSAKYVSLSWHVSPSVWLQYFETILYPLLSKLYPKSGPLTPALPYPNELERHQEKGQGRKEETSNVREEKGPGWLGQYQHAIVTKIGCLRKKCLQPVRLFATNLFLCNRFWLQPIWLLGFLSSVAFSTPTREKTRIIVEAVGRSDRDESFGLTILGLGQIYGPSASRS